MVECRGLVESCWMSTPPPLWSSWRFLTKLYSTLCEENPNPSLPLFHTSRNFFTLNFSSFLWQAIMQISTFLVIFILNICLLLTILHQRRFRKENLQPTVSAEQTKRSDWSTLPMLSACVVLYLVTQIPEFIDNAIFLLEKGCVMQASGDLKAIIKPVANFLANVNFSVNFLLYCGVDGKFRRKLGSLMTSWKDVTNFGAPSRLRHILGGSPATAPPSHAATKSTTSGTSATSSKGLIGWVFSKCFYAAALWYWVRIVHTFKFSFSSRPSSATVNITAFYGYAYGTTVLINQLRRERLFEASAVFEQLFQKEHYPNAKTGDVELPDIFWTDTNMFDNKQFARGSFWNQIKDKILLAAIRISTKMHPFDHVSSIQSAILGVCSPNRVCRSTKSSAPPSSSQSINPNRIRSIAIKHSSPLTNFPKTTPFRAFLQLALLWNG